MVFSRKLAVLSTLTVALLPGTEAFTGWSKQGTIIDGNAYQFDQATWDKNLAQPNATGSFPITGFDISQKFPSSQIDGWKLSINVTSSIPGSQALNPANASGQVFTGTSIYLKAPDNVISSVEADGAEVADETTWKVCVTVLTNGWQVKNDASTSENGTCSSQLSSDCVSDFQDAVADAFAKELDCYKMPSIPSSCGNSLSQANLTTQQYPLNSLNGTEIFVTASDAHDAGDDAAFDTAIQTVWPVLTVWGWNTRANVSDDTKPTVQLTCAQANNNQTGSGGSGGTSPSAAPILEGSAVMALIVTGLAGVLLF